MARSSYELFLLRGSNVIHAPSGSGLLVFALFVVRVVLGLLLALAAESGEGLGHALLGVRGLLVGFEQF